MIDTGRPEKVLIEYSLSKIYTNFFKVRINFFEDIFLAIIHDLRFFFDP